jgi:antitoxin component of MazEF toxin-antitoxin module
MEKKVNSVFGEDGVHLVKKLDVGEEQHTFWENRGAVSDNGKLRIEVISRDRKLKEVKISETINKGVWTTRFGPSYNPRGWEPAFKSEVYERLAEKHRKSIPEFVRSITKIQDLSESPKEVFFPHFLSEGRDAGVEKQKPAPQLFTKMVRIHRTGPYSLTVNFPNEVVDAMGLEGGKHTAWTKMGKSAVITPLEGVHYNATLIKNGTSAVVVVPPELMTSMKLKRGNYLQWSYRDGVIESKPVEKAAMNAMKIHEMGGSHVVDIPAKIFENAHLKIGMKGEWFADGEKMYLKMAEDYPRIRQLMETARKYSDQVSSVIPNSIAQKIGLKVKTIVGFRINEEGKLLVTPLGEGRIMRMYSFSDEDGVYRRILTYPPDKRKFLEEVGEKMKDMGEVSKDEIREIFNRHFKNLSKDQARARLDEMLYSLTERYEVLKRRNAYVEEKTKT